ncbi:MAG: SDR family oxidoreductase [Rhodospirillales bacterium]
MGKAKKRSAIIVGAGSGLSASFARKLASEGTELVLAARDDTKLTALAAETGATTVRCDACVPEEVDALFAAAEKTFGVPDLVLYNASFRTRGDFEGLNRDLVRKTLDVTAYGAFLVAQRAAQVMLPRGSGAIFFTGASASVKGYSKSAPFAMGKFALRGLAQSMARELSPKNIHVAHFVIDGGIGDTSDPRAAGRGEDGLLHPDAIAESYWQVYCQHRSAWSWELELRPWAEKF